MGRIAVAVVVALAVQSLVFFSLVSGVRDDAPLEEYPAVEVAILPPPLPFTDLDERPKAKAPPPRTSPVPPSRVVDVASMLPAQPAGTGSANGAIAAAPPTAAAGNVYFGCLGGTPLAKRPAEARYKCEEELGLTARRRGRTLEAAMADDKRAGYDAAAARQAYRRAPVSQLGNGSSMGCAHSNLGVGCPDDMLIPLGGKKF